MWMIEEKATFVDGADADEVLRRIASDLSNMAHTALERSPDLIVYSVGKARWWMGGTPLDQTDGGTFRVDRLSGCLVASLSLKRAFLGCLAIGLAVPAVALALDASLIRAALLGLLAFGWLWGSSFLQARRGVAKYLRTIAQNA